MLKLILSLLLASASAEAAAAAYGAADCRIGTLLPVPVDSKVSWSGACKDGFADGPGSLAWNDADNSQRRIDGSLAKGIVAGEAKLTYTSRKDERDGGNPRTSYEGSLRDGLPDGQGFFQYADGGMYEGGVTAGERHGTGIYLGVERSRYEGQWVDGKRQGHGKATFATGGRYDGEWKNNLFDGVGSIVYAGTPRAWQGNFVEGRPADVSKPVIAKAGRYSVPGNYTQGGSRIHKLVASIPIPASASWGQLSVAEQNWVKGQYYYALAPGDEPPYPVKGVQPMVKLVAEIQGATEFRGRAFIFTTVGADGKARSASIIGKVPAELAKYLSAAALAQTYKPAMCQGAPCEMIFPMYLYMLNN